MKFLVVILLSVIACLRLAAQSSVLDTQLNIPPGNYSTNQLIAEITKETLPINYSAGAVRKDAVEITTSPQSLHTLLELVFKTESYQFFLNEHKILVIPKEAKQFKIFSGFIEEATSKERLVGVNLAIPSLGIGTTTNAYGFYSLSVPASDTLNLIVSSMGYESQNLQLTPWNYNQFDILMKPKTVGLQEVVVTEKSLAEDLTQMSEIELKPASIKKVPAVMGEVDVLRVLQLLPGIQSGGEASSGLLVRGGSPDQNLILLDGVPVYNASHLFGFFSVFNADALKSVSITKGGFPARYGGRLSSVVNIDMKEGNMTRIHGAGSIGLISSKLTLEGPIVKNKTSFMLSGRRTYLDLLMKPIFKNTIGVSYHFGDVNAKLNHIFNRKNRLYLSFYSGDDKLSIAPKSLDQDFGLGWKNQTMALRYNHLYSSKLFGNLTATYSNYKFYTTYSSINSTGISDFEYLSKITDYGLRYDIDYRVATNHKIKAGIGYTYHDFRPGFAQFYGSAENPDSSLELSTRVHSHDLFYYVEDEWDITNQLKANVGLHYSQYIPKGAFYNYLQPRVSLGYQMATTWRLKASYAQMAQYIHLLSNNGVGLPTDLWVSSSKNIAPQYSSQVAAGIEKNTSDQSWTLSTEIYYKWMRNLITTRDGTSTFSTVDWENIVETGGTGKAYGAEFLVKRNTGNTTGWIGYTLAWSNRTFDNINNGQTFPYRYDRRHDLTVVLNHKFSERFDISLNWIYGTGMAFTAPIAEYYLSTPDDSYVMLYTEYSDRNAHRLRNYHRLDLSVNFNKKTRWGERTWNISLYNAYSRRNPYFVYVSQQGTTKKLQEVSLLPILPSVSYIFSF